MPRKKSRSEYKKARNRDMKKNKITVRLAAITRTRKKWANNEEYQKKQEERLEKLQKKPRYQDNIRRVKEERTKHKELQKSRRRQFLKLRKR